MAKQIGKLEKQKYRMIENDLNEAIMEYHPQNRRSHARILLERFINSRSNDVLCKGTGFSVEIIAETRTIRIIDRNLQKPPIGRRNNRTEVGGDRWANIGGGALIVQQRDQNAEYDDQYADFSGEIHGNIWLGEKWEVCLRNQLKWVSACSVYSTLHTALFMLARQEGGSTNVAEYDNTALDSNWIRFICKRHLQ